MGKEVEGKVVNRFHVDLKLIQEWIQKPIGQIETSQTHEYKAQKAK